MRLQVVDEDGAVATASLFAITTFLLLVGMLAVNIGGMWVSRRGQIADTDAAALAAAQRLTEEPCATDYDDAALELVQDSSIATTVSTPLRLNGVCDSGAGVVTVQTQRAVEFAFFESFFTEITDLEDAETSASSSVAYGQVSAASNVRPLAICAQELSQTDVSAYYPNAVYPVYRIELEGTPDSACVPPGETFGDGNIGIVDFDGSVGVKGGNNQVNDWIATGFPGEVDLGSGADDDQDCNNDDGVAGDYEPCQGKPSKDLSGFKFDPILCGAAPVTSDCLKFYVVVYDRVSPAMKDTGPPADVGPKAPKDPSPADGSNVRYDVASLASVTLRAVQAKGSEDDYIDLEYIDELTEGSRVGAVDGVGIGLKAVIQCAVDGADNCASVIPQLYAP